MFLSALSTSSWSSCFRPKCSCASATISCTLRHALPSTSKWSSPVKSRRSYTKGGYFSLQLCLGDGVKGSGLGNSIHCSKTSSLKLRVGSSGDQRLPWFRHHKSSTNTLNQINYNRLSLLPWTGSSCLQIALYTSRRRPNSRISEWTSNTRTLILSTPL